MVEGSLRQQLGTAIVETQRRLGTVELTWQLTRDELLPALEAICESHVAAARQETAQLLLEALKDAAKAL